MKSHKVADWATSLLCFKGKVEYMFTGIYEHTIDKKGRTSLPARFRSELTEGAYISVGIDKNLVIYSIPFFENLAKEVSAYSLADPIARRFRRRLFNKAELIEFDVNGRFLLPPYLREEFNFQDGDKIIFAGSSDYIEIWTEQDWVDAENETFQDPKVTEDFARLLNGRSA